MFPELDDYREMAKEARTPKAFAAVLARIVEDAEQLYGMGVLGGIPAVPLPWEDSGEEPPAEET